MGKLGNLLKKAMVVSMEDQITYCNKTIQVGPHVLVVTSATVDTTGESRRGSVIASRVRFKRSQEVMCVALAYHVILRRR